MNKSSARFCLVALLLALYAQGSDGFLFGNMLGGGCGCSACCSPPPPPPPPPCSSCCPSCGNGGGGFGGGGLSGLFGGLGKKK
ncbi:hypothetical protein GPALN_001924 [Globodera pallida]|nr:hypothetical protein GPALN_001924 [Globodera pallida]